MTNQTMPPARDFGWALKPTSSSLFEIRKRPNGQFCAILNHALLRGCTAEMIHWWFLHFPALQVRLVDTPGYENQLAPGYLLWHPIDHVSARLSGTLGPGGVSRAGATIHIREAMQYDRFGWKYPVDAALKIFYVGPDGWGMGKTLPLLGPVMMLRIHFRDVFENGKQMGVHYHYEVVIGASGDNFITRQMNRKLTGQYGPEFFEAWRRHNVIEVGVFENFLPALFAQKDDLSKLSFARAMDAAPSAPDGQSAQDPALFARRLAGVAEAADPYAFQQFDQPSFL